MLSGTKGLQFVYTIKAVVIKMKKILITDLDDTLYGWTEFFVPAFYAMAEKVCELTGFELQEILAEYKSKHCEYGSVEHPYVTLELPSVRRKYDGLNRDEIKNELGEAFHRFNSVRKERLKLYDGVELAFDALTEKGVTVIGYTDSCEENGFYRLRRLGIDKYFKHVYVSKSKFVCAYPSDEKIRLLEKKKPDIEALLGICESEGCSPSDVVYVGDSLIKDMYMAKSAGVTSVWLNRNDAKKLFSAKLEAISGWTDEELKKDAALKKEWEEKRLKPDFEISDFLEIVNIFK